MTVEQIISEKITELGSDGYIKELGGNVYISPSINEKKLKTAAKYIAKGIDPATIVAMIDTTILGSAKNGFVFTDDTMYYTRILSDSIEIPFNAIGTINEELVSETDKKGNGHL